jgi:hypothetical protein
MEENKIEQYLINLMVTYQQVDSDLWLLDDAEHGLQGIYIYKAESLVTVKAEIMDVPKQNLLELYTKLLELNATDVIHGAYALENGKIILIDTLEYDTMDYGDFRATLDSFGLAIAQHYPILSKYREKPADAGKV